MEEKEKKDYPDEGYPVWAEAATLPPPFDEVGDPPRFVYTAEQMRDYALAAVAQAEAKPAPSQIVGALSWSCAVPWEVASWLSAHPPTIDRAAPAAPAPAIAKTTGEQA